MTDFEVGQLLPIGGRVERDQRVDLRVVRRRAATRGVVLDDAERRHRPLGAVLPLADQVDHVTVGEAERRDVVGVHEHHAPPVGDAAVAVAEPVDRGVELVVAAQALQQQPALGHVRARPAG